MRFIKYELYFNGRYTNVQEYIQIHQCQFNSVTLRTTDVIEVISRVNHYFCLSYNISTVVRHV